MTACRSGLCSGHSCSSDTVKCLLGAGCTGGRLRGARPTKTKLTPPLAVGPGVLIWGQLREGFGEGNSQGFHFHHPIKVGCLRHKVDANVHFLGTHPVWWHRSACLHTVIIPSSAVGRDAILVASGTDACWTLGAQSSRGKTEVTATAGAWQGKPQGMQAAGLLSGIGLNSF